MKAIDIFLTLVVVMLTANGYLVQKLLMVDMPPYLAISCEAIIIFLCFVPMHRKLPLPLKTIMLISPFWGIFTYGSILTAARLGMDLSVITVVGKTNVIFAIILARFFFAEKIDKISLIGIIIAFSGVLFLLKTPNVLDNPIAFFFVILFAVSWAFFNVLMKKFSHIEFSALLCWIAFISSFQTLAVSAIFDDWNMPNFSYKDVGYLLYQGIISTWLMLKIWFFVLKRNPMYKVAPFALLVPIIGIIEGFFIFNEPLTVESIVSSGLVIVGVFISTCRKTVQSEPIPANA